MTKQNKIAPDASRPLEWLVMSRLLEIEDE